MSYSEKDMYSAIDHEIDFNLHDLPIETLDDTSECNEIPDQKISSASFSSVKVTQPIALLTGLSIGLDAELKSWADQKDLTIYYEKRPSDRVFSVSQISIVLIKTGGDFDEIRCSYFLDSHGERSPVSRESGRHLQTSFAIFDVNYQKPFFIQPTFPDFWLKCGTQHTRWVSASIPRQLFEHVFSIRLWFSSGSFYKC